MNDREINFGPYYENGPRMTLWLKPSFRTRMRLLVHLVTQREIVLDVDLNPGETRWLFGQIGKLLRAMKRDQANA